MCFSWILTTTTAWQVGNLYPSWDRREQEWGVLLLFCISFHETIYRAFGASQLGGTLSSPLRTRAGWQSPREEGGWGLHLVRRRHKFKSERRPAANTWESWEVCCKSSQVWEETWAKLCYLNTGFFWIKPNPRNEPSLDLTVYAVCTGRKHTLGGCLFTYYSQS